MTNHLFDSDTAIVDKSLIKKIMIKDNSFTKSVLLKDYPPYVVEMSESHIFLQNKDVRLEARIKMLT